jgi:hypothetical protein
MKTFLRMLLAALVAVPTLMAAQVPDTRPAPLSVTLDGVDVKDVGADRAHFEVRSHLTANRNLKIKRVSFARMRLGGVPIYLSPIDEHLQLEKGVSANLPRIPVTVYFRDLDSLDPLSQAVQQGQTTLTGEIRADLDLNLFERVASRDLGPKADIPVDITLPVEVPGGSTGKTAAITALKAAQVAMNLGGSALGRVRASQKNWDNELITRFEPTLVIAESRYSLRTKDGQQVDYYVRGLGFRISEDNFILTGEMIEPWEYDPDVAAAIHSKDASLIKENTDLLVWPAGETLDPNSARAMSRGQILLQHLATKSDSAYTSVDNKRMKIKLLRRDSDSNFAVLHFTHPEDKGPIVTGAAVANGTQNWDRLTLFRVDDLGQLETVPTPAHTQNGRIILEDPIDDRAFGSLLIAQDGAVGVVQDEHSAMMMKSSW